MWKNGANPTDSFFMADDVTFDDTATNQTVNLTTTVVPNSVTINGTKAYNITGAGKISGATGLVYNDTGTLTLATNNDYYGQTTVTAGTLNITGTIGPNSPLLITGGTVKIGSATALGDNSQFTTASTTINGGTTAVPGGTLDINGTGSLSLERARFCEGRRRGRQRGHHQYRRWCYRSLPLCHNAGRHHLRRQYHDRNHRFGPVGHWTLDNRRRAGGLLEWQQL